MAIALAAIGPCILEVIGLNPQGFSYRGAAKWPSQGIFGEGPFFQPTGMDEQVATVRLATRPHVMGGLDQYAILKELMISQEVVPFIRLGSGMMADVMGNVFVRSLTHDEEKIAPDGLGWRHEFEAELVLAGEAMVA